MQVNAPEDLLPVRQVELHLFFDALLEPQKSDIYQSVWRVVRLHTPKVCVRTRPAAATERDLLLNFWRFGGMLCAGQTLGTLHMS